MRIHILSDLHNEFGTFTLPNVSSDLLILAGDTDVGTKGAAWITHEYHQRPILYIIGNHEYYGKQLPTIQQQMLTLEPQTNLYILENRELILGNIRFLGCTLWTDYQLFGGIKKAFAMYETQQTMTDYRRIRLGKPHYYRKLRPSDTIQFHQQSRQFLIGKLHQPFQGKTVIITHHAPSPRSLGAYFKEDLVSAAYCTDLEDIIKQYRPDLWIHGHIHQCFDYMIEQTRILCNPRGYARQEEVKEFQPDFVVDI
jgi:hypothetical protein